MKIAVIQGPNLNMLGVREQHIYGPMTLDQIHEQMKGSAAQSGMELEFFQSNLEGEMVDKIQECLGTVDGIIINPAAYTHTSIAITDALAAVNLPTIEVHISNIHKREEFRQKSITAQSSTGVVAGFGPFGYHMALIGMTQILNEVQAQKQMQEQAAAAQAEAK
ncbi:MAG: type II 3-dehydroquinate dehydratase [Campylobacteraceae bacterium]|jgi:3-dehydroquinate dehydratase-2|nr:type II 3-dehydroquinate dehydratase [Campylobacteraceae bacterium]MBT3882543.1 type II 3-dehydroquinate dehydratase [Campylobacteraceae bacterium]MBT4030583.1 type II 3-dehydroquinate dehydratase [Campylobacteraceae bacterium]MBT4179288.1 type II 3-dehydroquinate dehydratase [Campylobacteraceae bacterium]MBT4572740.1 type II 3-dehydroquinate dehydratase [Campylobacteraceae bacterium]